MAAAGIQLELLDAIHNVLFPQIDFSWLLLDRLVLYLFCTGVLRSIFCCLWLEVFICSFFCIMG